MKLMFYLALLGAVGLAVFIFLEKSKKPSNALIDKERGPNESKNDTNMNQNQNPPALTQAYLCY
jgi:hypothetical protein